MDIRADPGTSESATNSRVRFAFDTQTFILVTLYVVGMDSFSKNFVHFILLEFLLSVVESGDGRLAAAPLGPLNTRLLVTPEEPLDIWVFYVCRNKFVISEEIGQPGYLGRLFNFNKEKLWNDRTMDPERPCPSTRDLDQGQGRSPRRPHEQPPSLLVSPFLPGRRTLSLCCAVQ